MEWFSQNWVWVLFFAGMVAMHLFGHGGHGGHGGDQNGPKPQSYGAYAGLVYVPFTIFCIARW